MNITVVQSPALVHDVLAYIFVFFGLATTLLGFLYRAALLHFLAAGFLTLAGWLIMIAATVGQGTLYVWPVNTVVAIFLFALVAVNAAAGIAFLLDLGGG